MFVDWAEFPPEEYKPMSVYSMTGYAAVQSRPTTTEPTATPALGMEIRSVNSRFLDLTFKLAEEMRAAEPALRNLLSTELRRGKVEIRGWIEGRTDHLGRVPSAAELQKLVSIQDGVRAWLPTAAPLSVADVIALSNRPVGAFAGIQEAIDRLATQAVQALKEARAREGERLASMLAGHVIQLRTLAEQARPMIPQLVEQQRLRFLERWQEALGETQTPPNTDAVRDRALTEATAFAIRIDVAEELTRMASHLDEIDRLIRKGGELGKRLDFLIQELHREANTLGSKSSSLELTRISVDMKVLIEQMREQVQNLE